MDQQPKAPAGALTEDAASAESLKSLSAVNQDIRTALYGMMGFAGLLGKSGVDDAKRAEFAHKIKESGDFLMQRLDEMLRLAGMEVLVPEEEPVSNSAAGELLIGGRVLIAEDNPLNAEITAAVLKEAGFASDWAEDGAICVEKVKEARPGYYNAVLMDIQMPNMDGFEATRAIRQLGGSQGRLPIIATTANAFEQDKAEALAAGMDGFLTKPVEVDKLISMIMSTLSKPR